MNRLSHQPKALLAAITLGLGFAVLGAGCTQGNSGSDTTSSMAGAASSSSHSANTGSGDRMGAGSNHANATANADTHDGMMAGTGNSTQPVSDTWLTTKVLGVLQTVDGLDNTDIGVETNNGVVTLTGRVDSQKTLDAAIAEIKTVEGVKGVDTSRLEIGSDAGGQ